MSAIQTFTPAEIASFRKAGTILRDCLNMLAPHAKPGISTLELDVMAERFIREHGGIPAFKGYHNYPSTLCTSINEECVHGMPGERVLKEGDIVSLDCGVIVDGLYTDACITVPVGVISGEARHLLDTNELALRNALSVIRAGARVGDISSIIEKTAHDGGLVPVRALTGHGLGRHLHEYPDIPNAGRKGSGPVLPAGTVIAVEPILAVGSDRVIEQDDGWTIAMHDGGLSAHFEHTILVTEDGCEVLA